MVYRQKDLGRAVLGQSSKKDLTLGCRGKNELKGAPEHTNRGD